jgi:RNA polymerase sigma-70 factor, ECF subfamily
MGRHRKDRPWAAGAATLHGTDLELVKAAVEGDAEAFDALIDRHAAEMFRLALCFSGARADAEDICQEAFIGAFLGLKRFDGRSSFKTWLTQILLRQAAKHWKKNKRHRPASIDANRNYGHANDDESKWSDHLPAASVNLDVSLDLLEIVGRLGEDHRRMIVLRELNGFSYDEISQALGIPIGTVESRLYRARAELRKLLKDYEP